jgi:hypothetical protein
MMVIAVIEEGASRRLARFISWKAVDTSAKGMRHVG